MAFLTLSACVAAATYTVGATASGGFDAPAPAPAPAPTFLRTNGSDISGAVKTPKSSSPDGTVVYAGTFASESGCEQQCTRDNLCTAYTWHDATPLGGNQWALQCYLRHDCYWDIKQQAGEYPVAHP